MKILVFIILSLASPILLEQESNKGKIENLNKLKQRLESTIKIKQDSLILINQRIDRLTQEDMFSKLKAQPEGMVFKATVSMSGKIRKENNPNSVILTLVNQSDTVLLTDFIGEYWIVNKGPYFGYINDMYINKTPELKHIKMLLLNVVGEWQ